MASAESSVPWDALLPAFTSSSASTDSDEYGPLIFHISNTAPKDADLQQCSSSASCAPFPQGVAASFSFSSSSSPPFDINSPAEINSNTSTTNSIQQNQPPLPPSPTATSSSNNPLPTSQPNSEGFGADSGDLGSGAAGDKRARTLKGPRLVWTTRLHKRFVDAVAHLGIKNAVPKTIMQMMSVDGLTRETVASHLQKYRLYLNRMQGLSSGGAAVPNGTAGPGSLVAEGDAATDRLFKSSPVPAHFFHPGRSNSDHFLPFVPVAALQQQHHHHQQMAAAAATVAHPQLHSQYPRQMGHFGSPPNGQFEHPFLATQTMTPNYFWLCTTGTEFPAMTPSSCIDGSGFLQSLENVGQVNPPTKTFVKVYKSGSFGRSLDITKFSSYNELRSELAQMFGLEGQLEDPVRSGWQLVFVDRENDVLLLGDLPWPEFVDSVWYIKILSPQEVQQMGKLGL